MYNYILIGDSGHAKVIEEAIELCGNKVVAKLDDKYSNPVEDGAYIKGPLSIIKNILTSNTKVIISIGDNKVRKRIVERVNIEEKYYGIVVHPSAIMSPSSSIGVGSVIMPGTILNAESFIGKHAIINTHSIIEHECKVNDYVHISPNATLTGGVTIGEGTQIGAGSIVIPWKHIGKWSMVGAGSTVISDIEDNVTVVGTPAKVIKKEGLLK